MAQIKVLQLKVDEEEGVVTLKEDDYKSSQELVGGYIECVSLDEDIDLWLNEEGKLMGLEGNFNLIRQGRVVDVVVGDVFFASHNDEGDTVSLNEKQIERIQSKFINRRNFSLD